MWHVPMNSRILYGFIEFVWIPTIKTNTRGIYSLLFINMLRLYEYVSKMNSDQPRENVYETFMEWKYYFEP